MPLPQRWPQNHLAILSPMRLPMSLASGCEEFLSSTSAVLCILRDLSAITLRGDLMPQ